MWPQITWIVLVCLSIGVSLANHGKSYTHNVFGNLFWLGVVATLLWYGGFFAPLVN